MHNLNPEDLSRKALLRLVEQIRRVAFSDLDPLQAVFHIKTAFNAHAIDAPEDDDAMGVFDPPGLR